MSALCLIRAAVSWDSLFADALTEVQAIEDNRSTLVRVK